MTIGEIIVAVREKKGLTQSELAKMVGMNNSTIHGYEHGASPRLDRLQIVLDALGLKIQIVEKGRV